MCLVFLFECLYDQQHSYKCLKATQKTAKRKSVQLRKCYFSSSFLPRPQCSTTISRKRFKFSPSFYHKTKFLSQCGALRPLSVFIATNSPWSTKLFLALPGCCPLRRTPFSNVLRMRRSSLVPKPKTTSHWSGSKTGAHMKLQVDQAAYGWHSRASSYQGLSSLHRESTDSLICSVLLPVVY